MENLGLFLDSLVSKYGPKQALVYKPGNTTEAWTYIRLREQSDKVGRWMLEQGVSKGDRVVIWADNSPWWVATYFAALRLGAVVVPLDIRSGNDFVERVVAQTDPKLAVISKALSSLWNYPAPAYAIDELDAFPEANGPIVDPSVSSSDVAALMFTSGTTGAPKGVILTHGNILANAEATDQVVPNSPRFRVVSLLPLSHMFEQNVGLLLAMKRGASIYYISSLQPAAIFEALKEHGATTMLLVPQALQLFMSAIEREVARQGREKEWHRLQQVAEHLPMGMRKRMFHSVHERLGGQIEFLVSGGAPIAPELIKKWELLGIPIIQGYGATEASPVISATTLNNRDPHTVGQPVPGMQVKVAKDGEVLIKGPSITQGYWNNPEATREAFEDGWYKTGDLGQIDEKGRIYLHGRKKDMIVLANGQNVYPEDVELVLKSIPGLVDAVVVGLPSERGAQVHAVIIPDPEGVNADSVVKQANARLAPHQYIRGITVWPDKDFPRTHTLKVKKHEVLKRLIEMYAPKEEHEQAVVAAAN